MFLHIQSALHISGVNQPQIENIWENKPRKGPKANLILPGAGKYFYSSHIVLGIISNLEMI